MFQMPGAGQILFNRLAEHAQADAFQHHPDFQRAETARKFRPIIPKSERFIRLLLQYARVLGLVREGGAGRFRVAIQHTATIDRKVEPLMRIERDRIGFGQSGKQISRRICQGRKAAIAGIDVHPEIESSRHLTHFRKWIERAGVHRPGVCHHTKRQMPGLQIFRDFRHQIVDPDLETFVHAH